MSVHLRRSSRVTSSAVWFISLPWKLWESQCSSLCCTTRTIWSVWSICWRWATEFQPWLNLLTTIWHCRWWKTTTSSTWFSAARALSTVSQNSFQSPSRTKLARTSRTCTVVQSISSKRWFAICHVPTTVGTSLHFDISIQSVHMLLDWLAKIRQSRSLIWCRSSVRLHSEKKICWRFSAMIIPQRMEVECETIYVRIFLTDSSNHTQP